MALAQTLSAQTEGFFEVPDSLKKQALEIIDKSKELDADISTKGRSFRSTTGAYQREANINYYETSNSCGATVIGTVDNGVSAGVRIILSDTGELTYCAKTYIDGVLQATSPDAIPSTLRFLTTTKFRTPDEWEERK